MSPRPHPRTRASSCVLAAALALAASPARAEPPSKQACVDAYESAQTLRRSGRLMDARAALVTCSQAGCPAAATADCVPWLAEVEQSLPSVVLAARDADGRELTELRVLLDGHAIASALDGKAIPVDPGVHTFVFVAADGDRAEERVVVREGEKNRRLTVTVGPRPASTEPAAPSAGARPIPAATWITGALGLAGLAVFAVVGTISLGEEDHLRSTCAPICRRELVDPIRVEHVVADIGLGVGVVSLGVATWLFVTRPDAKTPKPPPSSFDLVIHPSRTGVITSLGWAF